MALIEYNPPQEPWLDLVYRDDYIAVVNKPSGLLSVPGNQPQYYDSAMSRVKEKYGFCEPAHRLDMATSGILLFALSKAADRELKRQFREREPKKILSSAGLGACGTRSWGCGVAADLRLGKSPSPKNLL